MGSGRLWNSREMKNSLTFWILHDTLPLEWIQDVPLHGALGEAVGMSLWVGSCDHSQEEERCFIPWILPSQGFWRSLSKPLIWKNGEGYGSQYTKYRNLSRTSYKNHELSPTFSAACVEQMAQSEAIGTAFLMTLKFWVANWKIWSTGDVFIYFSMWCQWLWKRREALKNKWLSMEMVF